jgi:hypothetical protein
VVGSVYKYGKGNCKAEHQEESPKIQKIKAESEARGELRVARRMFIKIVGTRFPTLIELAKKRAAEIHSPEALEYLALKVVDAPDEKIARWLATP